MLLREIRGSSPVSSTLIDTSGGLPLLIRSSDARNCDGLVLPLAVVFHRAFGLDGGCCFCFKNYVVTLYIKCSIWDYTYLPLNWRQNYWTVPETFEEDLAYS